MICWNCWGHWMAYVLFWYVLASTIIVKSDSPMRSSNTQNLKKKTEKSNQIIRFRTPPPPKEKNILKEHVNQVQLSGQIIATSHDLTPNGGLVREIPLLFQGYPGWWNIIFWPDQMQPFHQSSATVSPLTCRTPYELFFGWGQAMWSPWGAGAELAISESLGHTRWGRNGALINGHING